MTRKAIAAMQRHTGRLNRLIEDLLSISRMEEKGVRLETKRTEIAPLLRTVLEQAEREIAERGAQGHPLAGGGTSLCTAGRPSDRAGLLQPARQRAPPRQSRRGHRIHRGDRRGLCCGRRIGRELPGQRTGHPARGSGTCLRALLPGGGDRARQSGEPVSDSPS